MFRLPWLVPRSECGLCWACLGVSLLFAWCLRLRRGRAGTGAGSLLARMNPLTAGAYAFRKFQLFTVDFTSAEKLKPEKGNHGLQNFPERKKGWDVTGESHQSFVPTGKDSSRQLKHAQDNWRPAAGLLDKANKGLDCYRNIVRENGSVF